MSKVSAIEAIKQPFNLESKSTQTVTAPRQIRLGGTEKTVFDLAKNKSVTVVDGGTSLVVTTRVRTGKTAKDKKNGHIPYQQNRRIFQKDGGKLGGGTWVKTK